MKFTRKQARKVSWQGVEAYIYTSAQDLSTGSAATFTVTNSNHGQVMSKVSDRVYYVVDGSGEFIINNQVIPVAKTDVILIPKNTPYDYRGTMTVFLVHVPAFDPKQEVILEAKPGRIK